MISKLFSASLLCLLLCSSVNGADSNENLDLIRAAAARDVVKVRELLSRGADVNARHPLTRWSALGTAAFYGSPEIVDLLIRNGAHVNSMDAHRRTPLMKAVTLGPYQVKFDVIACKAKIAKMLLEAGANPYMPDGLGQPAWQMPNIDKYDEIVSVFEQAKIKESKEVSLISAVARADVETVHRLLAKGADVRFQDGYGWNALREAIVTGNTTMAKLLVSSGADVNAKFAKGWTPLMLSVRLKQPEIIRILLAAKADPKAVNESGDSAKDIARNQGSTDILAIAGLE